jgi:hypothetical protein
VERSRRSYFLLLALAGILGWSYGLWAAPIIAFAALEAAWTASEWARDRGVAMRRRARRTSYVR